MNVVVKIHKEPTLKSVAQWDIHNYWTRVIPYLNRVIEAGATEYSLSDIHHFLMSGNFQLWHDPEWRFVVVTTIQTFGANPSLPTSRYCLILYCAGDEVDSWCHDVADFIQDWAIQAYNIHTIRIVGREGWAKKLEGFKRSAVTFERTR